MADSDSDAEAGMSFMFDAASAVSLKRFSYSTPSGRIVASLNVIDSNPGAVISGHYLWPASEQLCSAVCSSLPSLSSSGESSPSSAAAAAAKPACTCDGDAGRDALCSCVPSSSAKCDFCACGEKTGIHRPYCPSSWSSPPPPAPPSPISSLSSQLCSSRRVLELGAGCALFGLVCCQLPCSSPSSSPSPLSGGDGRLVVVTDYDPGVLSRAKGNRDETMKSVSALPTPSASSLSSLSGAQFHSLSWGVWSDAQSIKSFVGFPSFDLVVGCDVVYDLHVVEPLFKTAALLLDDRPVAESAAKPTAQRGAMAMSQSFVYDDKTEAEIDRCCGVYGFERTVLWMQDKDEKKGLAFGKIQVFNALKRGDGGSSS